METLERETADRDRLQLWIAFDYGGRAELADAARRMIEAGVRADEVDEDVFAVYLYAPEMPDPDLVIRTSGELRMSNFLLWQLAYSEFFFSDTLWPDFGEDDLREARGRVRGPATAVRRPMSSFWSRILISIAGIPLVLWLVYLGGWALFGLALVAALFALHELYWMTRTLRPVVLAGYSARSARCSARSSAAADWALGGLFATLAFAFVLQGRCGDGQSAAVGRRDLLGVVWIGLGLAHAPAAARHRRARSTGDLHRDARGLGRRRGARTSSGCLFGRHKLAPTVSPGKTWEGLAAGTVATIGVTFIALYKQGFLSIPESLALGAVIAVAAPLGDLFESALKRDMGVKDSGRLLGGHGGVLDRIDALLFAWVAAYYVIAAFGQL